MNNELILVSRFILESFLNVGGQEKGNNTTKGMSVVGREKIGEEEIIDEI